MGFFGVWNFLWYAKFLLEALLLLPAPPLGKLALSGLFDWTYCKAIIYPAPEVLSSPDQVNVQSCLSCVPIVLALPFTFNCTEVEGSGDSVSPVFFPVLDLLSRS